MDLVNMGKTQIRKLFRPGPLNKKVLGLAFPVLLEMISHTMVMVADTVMVGPLGASALAATGLGSMAYFTLFAFILNSTSSIQILTARRIGEKRDKDASELLKTSIVFSLFSGIIISIVSYYASPFFVSLLNEDTEVSRLTTEYLQFRSLGTVFFFVLLSIRSFLDGLGKTYIGMITAFVVTFINIFFNWVLIYGNLGFESFGVKGAAIASSLSGVVGMIVICFYLFKKDISYFLRIRTPIFNRDVIREILLIGLAPGIDGVFTNIAFLIFQKFAGMIGVISLASSSVIFTIMSLSFMPGFAFGISAITILGQSIGAGKAKLAELGTYRSAFFSAIIMGAMGGMFLLSGNWILSLFTNNQAIIQDAYPALIIMALIQVGDAYHMVLGSALRSAGLVYWVMGYYIIYSFLLMLPLSYFLGIFLGLGTPGLWASISIWILFLSVTFFLKFRSGSWKKIQI